MPIYEYHCSHCNQDLELIRKVSEAGDLTCPQCSTPSLVKKTSMTAFHLKGGGWYADGYSGGKPTGDAAKPSSEGAKSGDSGSSTSADRETAHAASRDNK